MIQELNSPFYNQYTPLSPEADDFVICIARDAVLSNIAADGTVTFPTVKEIANVGHYLFSVGNTRYFGGEAEESDRYAFQNARTLAGCANRETAFAAVTGYHLQKWYADNRFCGCCGQKMHHSHKERAVVCDCGNTVYPKICPAVIVGILHDGKICLTKYNHGYGHWALVAGFCEIGETVEETVHREVSEEVGLKVKNLRYYKSQPWGRSSSLLFGFFCEVEGDATLTVDNSELQTARWFSPEEIDFENDGVSLTREMIGAFKQGLY